MNTLQLFNFEDFAVRVVEQDGEPWFVGKDICNVLDIKDHKQALSELHDDERGWYTIPPPCNRENDGGAQTMIIISEAGVFRLIFRSRKPEAERFKRWVLHEVLPQIRRTGRYIPAGDKAEQPQPLSEPFSFSEPLNAMAARISFIREARQLFGIPRARQLWAMAGFPTTPEEEPTITNHTADGQDCLTHLLSASLKGHIVLDLIRAGDGSSNSPLAKAGIRVLQDGAIAVATAAHMVAPIFARSHWANGNHIMPLLSLYGAARFKIMRFNGSCARTILVPPEHLYPSHAATTPAATTQLVPT